MFDGSSLPLKENIMKTKAVVDYAHQHGTSVEGELGIIGGTEEGITIDGSEVRYTIRRCKVFCRINRGRCFSSSNWYESWAI